MAAATQTTDILVIGAGPAGIIAAGVLHELGHKVLVVEKQKFPRFVIGESLLPRCMDHIEAAGLMVAAEAAGFQKKYGAIFHRDGAECDFNFSDQHTKGWTWTWQVPRADFDKTLADAAIAKGITIDFETSVDDVKIHDDRVETKISNAEGSGTITSKYIIDGSGWGRVLPRLFDLDKPSNFPMRKAVFAHILETNRPEGAESNRITITSLSDDIWIWSIPFSTEITSVGFVGEPTFFDDFNGDDKEAEFRRMLEKAPVLNERYKDKDFVFEPRTIAGYSAGVKQLYGPRYVLTGNSTEFLDPVFSSGVTFAMESAATAARLINKEMKGQKVDWEKEYSTYIKQGVDTFRSYVIGWYNGNLQNIFFAEKLNPEFKKQICSVLAGYVWDMTNPFVKKHDTILGTLNTILTEKLVK